MIDLQLQLLFNIHQRYDKQRWGSIHYLDIEHRDTENLNDMQYFGITDPETVLFYLGRGRHLFFLFKIWKNISLIVSLFYGACYTSMSLLNFKPNLMPTTLVTNAHQFVLIFTIFTDNLLLFFKKL